jgi:regulation of enolase protein 1 (concanavalin A-like superfamily)
MRGRLIYSRPKEVFVFLPNQPGTIRPASSLTRIAGGVMAKSLTLLGPSVDPSKDCRLDKDEKSLKIRIDVPGKLHSNSPEIQVRKNEPVQNAPMTLAEVDGDFLATVTVTGEINPGAKLPSDRAVRSLPFTIQSAGLVLYQDKNNFIRLERAGSILTAQLTPIHRLLVEVVEDGKQAFKPNHLDIPEGDTTLILSRRRGRVRCMFVAAGSGSLYTFREFAADFPSKVKVGLSASNISAQPFTATFENFALVNDVGIIDATIGD